MTQEALKLALEALELHGKQYPHLVKGYCLDAITAIKEALAQHDSVQAKPEPEQEHDDLTIAYVAGLSRGKDLAPQRSESSGKPSAWVGLTDEDISEIVRGTHNTVSFVRAIEAKLREKNSQHKEKNT